jgi:hypothetical protein
MFGARSTRIMKTNLIFLLTLLVSCTSVSTNDDEPVDFDWLLGKWQRVENSTPSNTFETWKKENNQYVGHGYVLNRTDTVWQEHMILQQKENWVFTVSTPGNEQPVSFHLTDFDSLSFTVSNPQHDFPKNIHYQLKGKDLHALVTGDGTKLTYHFKSIN